MVLSIGDCCRFPNWDRSLASNPNNVTKLSNLTVNNRADRQLVVVVDGACISNGLNNAGDQHRRDDVLRSLRSGIKDSRSLAAEARWLKRT